MQRRRGPGRRLTGPPPARRGETGASALELVIVAPALLAIIFFSIQAGLYYYGGVVAQQAAREGVSQLRLAQTEDIANQIVGQIETGTAGYAAAVGRETLLNPEAEATYLPLEGVVTVQVTGQVVSLVPGLDLTVTRQVQGQIERFEGDDRVRP